MFDYSKGDPFADKNIGKMSKHAGANIDYSGATGA